MRIELMDITMSFQDQPAVDKLNAVMESGDLVALLGPSGCGKSTTLFMLAGLYKPTGGQIRFDGQPVNHVEPEHRQIGMVFQNYALYPHMTVLQNILFPLKMKKMPKREALERARHMAELVRIGHLLDRKPGQLSGGQQQRVAIARALVKEPKLLLLDEPLSNLDARLRLEMREEIRRIQREIGITTVFVTHDQEEALSIADRILLMDQGKLQQYAAPLDIYRTPANRFIAEFIGMPRINLLSGSYDTDSRSLRVEGASAPLPMDLAEHHFREGQRISLGIRPEDCSITEPGEGNLSGEITYIELAGKDCWIRVSSGDHVIRLIAPSDTAIRQGDRVGITLNASKLHLFDAESGVRLGLRSGEAAGT
ncbi:ABC transporter ATP-binding protein [Paenibacillus filicis]|uniref:ABC transporter ATP-binding protein n=1 Tax=Paenibacillus gyeongsangnamensis TaxID=3388067 RepID=A0ABT4Q2I3_9BACL|nr:ABC transporter ATP-binding protein [Paenibacillus filicis]MCZ8511018.1 ABC transporter ATP-binding protein [Paenibacillus filicis]